MEKVKIGGCIIYYNSKNISKAKAIQQFYREQADADKKGSRLRTYIADVPHKKENWYEMLRRAK